MICERRLSSASGGELKAENLACTHTPSTKNFIFQRADREKSKKSQTEFSHTVIVVIVHATVLRLGDTLSGVAKRGFALALKAGFC